MGRPKLGEKSRRELLVDSAFELFRAHGYHRVSIEEICEKAKVSKVTFYKHFENKPDLLICLLDQVSREMQKDYSELIRSNLPFRRKVERIIEMGADRSRGFGEVFMKELLDRPDPRVLEHVLRTKAEFQRRNVDFFTKGQKERVLNPDWPPEFFLVLTRHINQMIRDPEVARLYPRPIDRMKAMTQFFFHGISHSPGPTWPKEAL